SLSEDDACSLLELYFYNAIHSDSLNEAKYAVDRLTDTLTSDSARVAILRSIYAEQTQGTRAAADELRKCTFTTPELLKRHVAIIKSTGDKSALIDSLIELLDTIPADPEVWSELGETYYQLGLYQQSVYCFEEVLLSQPLAYNIYARTGEVLLSYMRSSTNTKQKETLLTDAMKRFARAVELSDDYIRGLCGLLIATKELLLIKSTSKMVSKLHDHTKLNIERVIADSEGPDIEAAKLVLA
ncbi:hypothetical protein CANCADRAFT_18485, partial [Tortispora caseinolytica NRRL Y-17796]